MRVSQRALAVMMVVNVAAALGVYLLSGFERGLAASLIYGRYRDLEQGRVIAVNEEAMRAHPLPEISQGDSQTVVPEYFIGVVGGGNSAGAAVGLLVVNAIVMWVWLLRTPAGPGDRCAQVWADEPAETSKEDPHRGRLP